LFKYLREKKKKKNPFCTFILKNILNISFLLSLFQFKECSFPDFLCCCFALLESRKSRLLAAGQLKKPSRCSQGSRLPPPLPPPLTAWKGEAAAA
jgi:hypothetical protein